MIGDYVFYKAILLVLNVIVYAGQRLNFYDKFGTFYAANCTVIPGLRKQFRVQSIGGVSGTAVDAVQNKNRKKR